ncbi:MAG TPA: ABC transporter transmembrane domain-containing protein, partial [Kiloniellaceae bacterium]|nr:ABC transporter transmembrane domain-containing protein [Kiloniellaceae bacterium]
MSTVGIDADPARAAPPQSTRALVGRLLRAHVRPQLWRILAALFCMAVVALTTAAFTQLMKPIINDVFVARREEMLLPIAGAALAVFLAKGLATYGQTVLMAFVGHRVVADLQAALYAALLNADLAYFNATSPGNLVSRFISDLNRLRSAVSDTLTGLGKDSLTAFALVAVMFYEDWLLATVAFFAFPTAILPIVRIGRRLRRVAGSTQAEVGRLTVWLDETFQGIRHIKAYGMEAHEAARTGKVIDEVFRLNYKAARTRGIIHPIMEMLGGLAIVAVILYGGHQVIAGSKDAGSFFAFITALLLAYEPVKRLAKLNANLQEGLAAAQRVFQIMDLEPAIRDAATAKPLDLAGGKVTFEKVTFGYGEGQPALDGVSLEVPAGKTAALVGPSGAGKSTILNLIPRFYDVESGRVCIDGQDLRDLSLVSLRAAIALVSQESLLFDDTVRANIAYGRPDAGDAEVARAARLAAAADFIAALPQGYDTPVGPRGGNLSGGQRQRIAIARAILKDAPILLLDEATSALDSDSERQVQDALAELKAGRTTLVIAHRLSTVMDADVIFVVENGRIVQQGRHGELLARGGTYQRLYAAQFA